MTARHAATEAPRTACQPLDGHPAPGDVLRAAAEALPVTDPRGFLVALAHSYDRQDDTTDERLVRDLATERGIPENLVRLSVGMRTVTP